MSQTKAKTPPALFVRSEVNIKHGHFVVLFYNLTKTLKKQLFIKNDIPTFYTDSDNIRVNVSFPQCCNVNITTELQLLTNLLQYQTTSNKDKIKKPPNTRVQCNGRVNCQVTHPVLTSSISTLLTCNFKTQMTKKVGEQHNKLRSTKLHSVSDGEIRRTALLINPCISCVQNLYIYRTNLPERRTHSVAER